MPHAQNLGSSVFRRVGTRPPRLGGGVAVCKFVIGGAGQIDGRPISVSSISHHGPMKICCRAGQLKLSVFGFKVFTLAGPRRF